MPIAASATSPCSRSASASRPTSPKARRSRRPPSVAARRGPRASAATGTAARRAVDAFDAKADALALLAALGVPAGGLQVVPGGPAWFHPGRSGTLQFGPKNVVGAFGEIHPKVLKALDLKGPLVAFEITLDALPPPQGEADQDEAEAGPARLPAASPATSPSWSAATSRPATSSRRRRAPSASSIAGVDVFDVYEGAGIDPDKKSVAIAVTLQPTEKTLTDAEIEAVSAKIVGEVAKKTGAVLRG